MHLVLETPKVALKSETCMQAKRLDGCPSASFLTILICLQYSDNNFWESDISNNVLYVPGARISPSGVGLRGSPPPTTQRTGLPPSPPAWPPLFYHRKVDFVIFMQFLAILLKLLPSPLSRPHLENSGGRVDLLYVIFSG